MYFVLRKLKQYSQDKVSNQNYKIQLTSHELSQAEDYWIRYVQAQSFARELQYFEKQGSAPAPVYINQFGLFLDDKLILRCRGRLNNSVLVLAGRNTILLPSKHTYVCRLIHYRIPL